MGRYDDDAPSVWQVVGAVGCMGIATVGLLAIGVGGYLALRAADTMGARPARALVTDRRWTRELAVERWSTVTGESSCQSVPDGATVTWRGGGTRPSGLGPRSSTKRCKYKIDAWQPIAPRRTTGPREPRFWPAPVSECAQVARGCLRSTARTETLTLDLDLDGAIVKCAVPAEVWDAVAVGGAVEVPIGAVFGAPACDRVQPVP